MIGASANSRSRWLRESLAGTLVRETLIATSVAAVLAAIMVWVGPPGGDFAAHVYQRSLFVEHGFGLWNNLWYSGRYDFVTYSFLYYPLAALLGIRALAVLSIAVAAFAFSAVVGREWGTAARWSSRSLAVLWAGAAITAAFPFMLGIAFALLALWALQARARWWFTVFVVLSLAASPIAFLLLGVVLAGIGLARIQERRQDWPRLVLPTAVLVICALAQIVISLVFPGEGRLTFPSLDLLAACAFCAIGALVAWRVAEARPLRWIFPLYLVACVAVFLVPTTLGHNITRLRYFAFPLALLLVSLRGFRPRLVAGAVLALAFAWNLSPLVVNYAKERGDPESSPSYWQPAVRYLQGHLDPSYRVEVVDTAGHWGAAYLPHAGIPIARGWFEQDDYPQNEVLYGNLSRASYLRWLHGLGVRYVVLTRIAADNSSRAEATLIRAGRSGLKAVLRTHDLSVYEVPDPRPIVTGPARPRILSLGAARIRLALPGAGSYRLAVRYSPYLRLAGGCLKKSSDGLTEISVQHRGLFRIDFSFGLGRALDVLTGNGQSRCG